MMNNQRLKDIDEEDVRFMDWSKYKGTWNALGMDGVGRYTLPHFAVLEGQFRDGMFHGHGCVHWPGGQRVDGVWNRGKCTERRYVFNDGLIFHEDDWKYCKFPDRRYQLCIINGLRPAGATLRTKHLQPYIIPPKCYDAGIGIFDPSRHCILSYNDSKKVLEIPNAAMVEWIIKNCRKGWTEPTGHQKDLYENWYPRKGDPPIFPPTLLPFTDESFECWWKRLSTFEREDMKNIENQYDYSFLKYVSNSGENGK